MSPPEAPTAHPFPITIACHRGQPVIFDAAVLEKVNLLVGDKGTGKSHTAKAVLSQLVAFGVPIVIFDVNREFTDLPGAVSLRLGDNYKVQLGEVGLGFLSAMIEDSNPFTETARGAFEHYAPRFMEQERRATGFPTVSYLHERAERGDFWNNDMVNNAIEARLAAVERTGIFEDDPTARTLAQMIDTAAADHGFVVIDLAELPINRMKSLVRAMLRQMERVCQTERDSCRGHYPIVMLEEAHLYTAPNELLNLVTRGRHLGITVFFMTNTPGNLPEVVIRQLDNLVVTGLSHASDRRLIAKSALSDDDTLQALAVGLGRTEALVVGRATRGYPLVVNIDPLPDTWPTTGATRSVWQHIAGATT